MTEKTDPMAENHARNALADLIAEGPVLDPDNGYEDQLTNADLIARAHTVTWERVANPNGQDSAGNDVYLRRYAMRGPWEVDPEGERYHDAMRAEAERILGRRLSDVRAAQDKATPRCVDPDCPNFYDPSFGEGSCPADHALSAMLGPSEAVAVALRQVIEAFRSGGPAAFHSPEATTRAVAERLGVTL